MKIERFCYYFNALILIILCTFLNGCFPTTKYTSASICHDKLASSNKVLFYYVSDPECGACFSTVEWVFKKHDIPLSFVPAEEYNLKKAGIKNPLDSQYYNLLLKQGYTHFLLVELVEKKSKRSSMDYYSPFEVELNDPYNAANRNSSKVIKDNAAQAELKFSLYSIVKKEITYRVNVKTTLNSIINRDDEGGETHYNLGSTSMAESTALKKGAKRIISACNKQFME